jgi:hypothetical protein
MLAYLVWRVESSVTVARCMEKICTYFVERFALLLVIVLAHALIEKCEQKIPLDITTQHR